MFFKQLSHIWAYICAYRSKNWKSRQVRGHLPGRMGALCAEHLLQSFFLTPGRRGGDCTPGLGDCCTGTPVPLLGHCSLVFAYIRNGGYMKELNSPEDKGQMNCENFHICVQSQCLLQGTDWYYQETLFLDLSYRVRCKNKNK